MTRLGQVSTLRFGRVPCRSYSFDSEIPRYSIHYEAPNTGMKNLTLPGEELCLNIYPNRTSHLYMKRHGGSTREA